MRTDWVLTGAGAAVLLGAMPALAEAAPQRLLGAPGVPLPLAVESSARDDCTLGTTPEFRIVVAPIHGEIALREGQLRRRGSACPAAPGYVVMYVADSDFNGADMVTIEVSDGAMATLMAFDIVVEGKITVPADAT